MSKVVCRVMLVSWTSDNAQILGALFSGISKLTLVQLEEHEVISVNLPLVSNLSKIININLTLFCTELICNFDTTEVKFRIVNLRFPIQLYKSQIIFQLLFGHQIVPRPPGPCLKNAHFVRVLVDQ